jgi:hypothetical protein
MDYESNGKERDILQYPLRTMRLRARVLYSIRVEGKDTLELLLNISQIHHKLFVLLREAIFQFFNI